MVGPKLDPPEPPEPCPHCEVPIRLVNVTNVKHHGDGTVTGDTICPECGEVLETGALLKEPN